jgi:hypothetical protein
MVLDFDRFIRNICKRTEFVKNLLKATCLTLRRLFRGRLLIGRIHCMCVSMVYWSYIHSVARDAFVRWKNRMLIVWIGTRFCMGMTNKNKYQ